MTPPIAKVLTRSVVTKADLSSNAKNVQLTASDWVFSEQGPLGPNSKCPPNTFGDLGSAIRTAPEDVLTLGIPILIGELSDEGAKDPATGALAEKGRIPGFFLGRFVIGNTQANLVLQYLVCGGGGGYGSNVPNLVGGGGGGRAKTGSVNPTVNTYAVVVGGAGAAGANGGDSSVLGITALGGGFGGRDRNQDNSATAAGDGGNGGGAGNAMFLGTGVGGGDIRGGSDWQSQTPGVGLDGGNPGGRDEINGSAGGGGSGGAGGNADQNKGGDGGPGLESDISGASAFYGAGGAGCGLTNDGLQPECAYGRGGYGGWHQPGQVPVQSQPGIVILRYQTGTVTATGGTITTSGGWTIHTFTSNGTFDVTDVIDPTSPEADPTTGLTFAAMYEMLLASWTAGTLVADYTSIIGATYAGILQGLAELPNTYTLLANVITYPNVDALLANGTTAPPGDVWGFLAFGIGAWYLYISVFGSDLGNGKPENKHDRTKFDLTTHVGSDLLVPGYPGWPFPQPYMTFVNDAGELFCITGLLVRGDILDDHINGIVNITVNAIGRMDIDGKPVMRLHDIEQYLYENHLILKSKGEPPCTDADAPRFSDGTPIIKSSTFRGVQNFTIDALGGIGLEGAYYSDTDQIATTDVLDDWMKDTETKTGQTSDGQLQKYKFDPEADPTDWPELKHELEAYGQITYTSGDERENISKMCGDWDPDAQKARIPVIPKTNKDAIKYWKNREKPGDVITNKLVRKLDQLQWVLARRNYRLAYGIEQIVVRGPHYWRDYNEGQGILFTTEDLEYNRTPMIILRVKFELATRSVTLTLWDVSKHHLLASVIGSRSDGESRLFYATDDTSIAPFATDTADAPVAAP